MRQMSRRPLITPRSAPRIAGMVRIAPAPDLAEVVEQHWVVAWDHRGSRPVVQEVLPDPCVNLAVEPAGVLLYGVAGRTSRHVLSGAGAVLGTKFRPGGFSGFVDGPVRALNDRVIAAADAFGDDGAALERALAGASTTTAMVEIVAAFLRARRPPPDPGRTLVRAVVEAMRDAPPGTTVADVARDFAVAPRTLQRMFAAHVGASPKRVLQRFRHQNAADRLAAPGPGGLARLAAELGYFDQAHFTQDFRRATGRLPSSAQA
jgi:AraC-like DNA-binding protein